MTLAEGYSALTWNRLPAKTAWS